VKGCGAVKDSTTPGVEAKCVCVQDADEGAVLLELIFCFRCRTLSHKLSYKQHSQVVLVYAVSRFSYLEVNPARTTAGFHSLKISIVRF